ncbi:MAG: hypothetical protein J6Q81_07190, partial [Lentisphaeria bacterium]|nr:hypothetical protein [Lentisphaeria bacterium]
FVLGGNSIAAFYKLSDGALEPLMALCLAGAVWSAAAYISSRAVFFLRRNSQIYFPATATWTMLFTLAAGGVAAYCGNGTAAACVGIIASAAATACTAHSFTSSNYKLFDRLNFIFGCIAGALIWFAAAVYSRLAWMETLFFYTAIFLLVAWAFASPLTRYGSSRKRWCWFLILSAGAIASFYTVPVFSPPPSTLPAGKMWTKTNSTANGRRFILQEKSGRFGFYTPQNRVLAADKEDENLQAAVLALLSLPEKAVSAIHIAAPSTSVLPGFLKNYTEAKIRHHRIPETVLPRKFKWRNPLFSQLLPNRPTAELQHNSADIVLITALPENPYPVFLQHFLQYLTVDVLRDNGMAAIPAKLLKNPTVFNFMHEKFAHSGVLPGAGELWLFSNHDLDLSLKNISRKMQKLLNDSTGINSEMFEVIYSGSNWIEKNPESGSIEVVKYGFNPLWGSWWWFWAAVAAAVLWRLIRLFGERRDIMYSYFNAIENGFSGMGVFVLALSLLLVHSGAYTLFLAVAAISFAFFFGKFPCGGVWGATVGVLLIMLLFFNHGAYNFLLIIIMLQTITLTGAMPSLNTADPHSERLLLCATFTGMMLASWLIAALWIFNIPLLPIWGLFLLARVPGIWQYSHKSVYYNKTK